MCNQLNPEVTKVVIEKELDYNVEGQTSAEFETAEAGGSLVIQTCDLNCMMKIDEAIGATFGYDQNEACPGLSYDFGEASIGITD